MKQIKEWFKLFSKWLFSSEDAISDECRSVIQKDLYKKSTGSDVEKELYDKNQAYKEYISSDHTDNFKFESPSESFRNSAEKEYFNDKIITPLSEKEKQELNTLFAEEILPYATLDKTFEEPHVTSGYLHIDDPTFVNAATSYVDNSQKVEHQLDEQKSEEIKTKKNKTKYNKNKKK